MITPEDIETRYERAEREGDFRTARICVRALRGQTISYDLIETIILSERLLEREVVK